jgi:hypothetical protein
VADFFDQASDREMADRDLAIKNRLANPVKCNILAKGFCLYCGDDFEHNSQKLYCDGICADRHANRLKSERK